MPQSYERRSHPRIPTDEAVTVTLLGPVPLELYGTVTDLSAQGARLVVSEQVPLSVPLRIDGFGTMLLGEACYCRFEDGGWQTGIVLEHVLWHVEELAEMALKMC